VAETSQNSIVVCAIARDVSETFDSDFKTIMSALERFKKVFWIVVESDSNDNSAIKLEAYSEMYDFFTVISLGSLSRKLDKRTERLAFARNAYLKELLSNSKYQNAEVIAIADLNKLNTLLNKQAVEKAFEHKIWDMCTANQSGPYYDIWALRHEFWSPNDCWRQLDFYRKYTSRPNFTLNAAVNIRMLKIPISSEPIKVDSAFGGFALIKKKYISNDKMYNGLTDEGLQVCEHVSFCRKITEAKGEIYILPTLINTDFTDHSRQITLRFRLIRNCKYPIKLLRKMFHR
jgi:hypothetical protein